MPKFWLFLSDPADYHWDTLFVKGKELWDGLPGATAHRYLKQVRKGDKVLCYHGAPDRSVYGIAVAARDAYLDPHDPKKRLLAVDLKAIERLPRSVSHRELKMNPRLRKLKLLRMPRLVICPLTEQDYNEILRMGGIPSTPHLFAP